MVTVFEAYEQEKDEKMKAMSFEIKGIKCDAQGCDYNDDTAKFEEYDQWLNKPCPKCGANLLTETDLNACKAMMGMADILNEAIGDVPDGLETARIRFHMDGKGIKRLERVDN